MKNTKTNRTKRVSLLTIALIAVISFSFCACDILSEDDGSSGNSQNEPGELFSSGISAIAYGNGKFVAGGTAGRMAPSTDGVTYGITWTAVPCY